MDSSKEVEESSTVPILESKRTRSNGKGKSIDGDYHAPPPVAIVSTKAIPHPKSGMKKGIAILDFILRLGAIGSTLGAAAVMGNNEQILPFFTQFLQFHAQWTDFPMFQFFVGANAIAGGLMVLFLPFSIVCIVIPLALKPRFILVIMDLLLMALVVVAASSASAVVYLTHNGSQDANWNAVCQQYTDFCQVSSMAVVVSFVAALFLACLVVVSSVALKRT
ncbi:casparian strip membrane protein 4-like [Trifolium pratense]|nr:casparian strip membrane protein 4-like [Trifolium pratense]